MILTAAQIAAATSARPSDAERFLPFFQGARKAYDISTPQRVAGFLSQIGHESGGLARPEESLDYSTDALLRLFGRHRINGGDNGLSKRQKLWAAVRQARGVSAC